MGEAVELGRRHRAALTTARHQRERERQPAALTALTAAAAAVAGEGNGEKEIERQEEARHARALQSVFGTPGPAGRGPPIRGQVREHSSAEKRCEPHVAISPAMIQPSNSRP